MHSLKVLRHGSHSFTCKLHHACFSFVSINQMAPPLIEVADIQFQLTTPKRMKGWVGLVGWPIVDGYPHKWSPISYRLSAGWKVHRPKTDVLPLCHATSQLTQIMAIERLLWCSRMSVCTVIMGRSSEVNC